ncbi:MAG: protein-disulfide reductase DsbD [Gammaproteobacteria bacterium]|nr:protein-disulfide reductase DsbD [Gammaproteobacteria bacterium]
MKILTSAFFTLFCLLPLTAHSQGSFSDLFGNNNSAGSQVLAVDDAFPVRIETNSENAQAIYIDIAPGYYVYQDSLTFSPNQITPDFPQGVIKQDEFFGTQPVYTEPVRIPIENARDTAIEMTLQGCADVGVCYPPYRISWTGTNGTGTDNDPKPVYTIDPTAVALTPATTPSPSTPAADPAPTPPPAGSSNALQQLLADASLPAILGGFFAAGLLLAFTACLYPMIPILSGLIAGDPHRSGSLRAFGLSLVYIEATAITYALAGVAAGMTGAAIQADLQSPWVLGSFAGLFIILALGMFGLFELRMPAAIQTRLTNLSNRQRGGTWIGVAIMGVLSTLIVGACSGPALIAALVFIGSTGDAWLGGLALFTLANGMGLPLLLIGTAAGRWLPRSGPWMNTVRALFGIGFLAVALWMLERFLAGPLTLGLWGLLLLGSGVWLGAFEKDRHFLGINPRLTRALGLALLVWGAASLIGAAAGGRSVLQPLATLGTSMGVQGGAEQASKLPFRDVQTLATLEEALAAAQQAGRPSMVDIYADWCVYCVQLERRTFTDPRVHEAVAEAVLLRVDVTAMNDNDKEILRALNVYLPPAIIFFDPQGYETPNTRVVSFLNAERFIDRANAGLRPTDPRADPASDNTL